MSPNAGALKIEDSGDRGGSFFLKLRLGDPFG